MKSTLIYGLVSSAILPIAAQAAEPEVINLSPVIVIGESLNNYSDVNLAGSVDTITRDEVAESHVDNTMELFSKLPSVHFARYNQGVINQDIGIRGFAADGVTPHAKLLIDGIPSNIHNGYSELDQLFPGNIESLTVFKGTSDPRYGLYNLAGSYNVETRSDASRSIQGTLGSFSARELQGYWGDKTGDLNHSYFFGYRQADGYRDHDNVEKYSLSGRWFYDVSPSTTVGFIARLAKFDADAPGYLTKEQSALNPKSSASYAAQDGGSKDTQSYSLHVDHKFNDDVNWSLKTYFNHYERERWVRFSQGGSLQNRFDDQDHYGLISDLVWDINDRWSVQWGASIERQDVLEQRFGTVGFQRVRDNNNVTRNRDYTFDDYSTFVQVNNAPVDWLEWNVALRADRLSGNFTETSNAGVQSTRDMYDFGTIIQPKANVFIYPTEDIVLFANAGRTFQPVAGKSAFTAGDRNARDISLNDGWELGAKWQPFNGLNLRLSYWEQQAKDEYILVDGTSRNVGKTLRHGFDTGLDWSITSRFNVWANYAVTDSEIQSEGADQGNQLRGIPNYTASIGTKFQVLPKLAWRVHYDVQGDAYVNEANQGGRFGNFNVLNTSVDYQTNWGTVNLQVNNLLDDQYDYVYDFSTDGTATIHSPGDGVNGSVSVTYLF